MHYEVSIDGTTEKRELPFVVGIFADLSGDRDPAVAPDAPAGLDELRHRTFIDIDRDSFDAVLERSAPRISLDDVATLAGQAITFESLADFDPARVAAKVAAIRAAPTDGSPPTERDLAAQASRIISGDRFKALEATWRGLFHLVSRTATSARLKICLFNATLNELRNDLEKAVTFDNSTVFKRIHDAAFGTHGGSPYGLLVGGYELGADAADPGFLQRMSAVTAAAHVPFVAAASPRLFGFDSFADLPRPRLLAKIFESPDHADWITFRRSEDARYVALVLPRVLLRAPRSGDDADAGKIDALWGNAAYFLAERITNAFTRHGIATHIRGVEGGGLVQGLPQGSTEVAITDARAHELDDLGFIPLCQCVGTGNATFFGARTTGLSIKYIDDTETAAAALAASLPCVLASSRFAHYLRVILREKMGGLLTRDEVEAYLNRWLSQYVRVDGDAATGPPAAFPLRAASIEIVEMPGRPGAYQATALLKPRLPSEELAPSLRLVLVL